MHPISLENINNGEKKGVAILGSTGSIGTQALDVIAEHSDKLTAEVITAHNNADLLIKQAMKFRPNVVVIGNESKYDQVMDALNPLDIKVYAGPNALTSVVSMDTVDVVLTAMVGYAGPAKWGRTRIASHEEKGLTRDSTSSISHDQAMASMNAS